MKYSDYRSFRHKCLDIEKELQRVMGVKCVVKKERIRKGCFGFRCEIWFYNHRHNVIGRANFTGETIWIDDFWSSSYVRKNIRFVKGVRPVSLSLRVLLGLG